MHDREVIYISGIPATGKSSFCRHLERQHGYHHCDFDKLLQCRPFPAPFDLLDRSCELFVSEIIHQWHHVVIDWGFPVACLPRVREFRNAGVRLIWFDGDIMIARRVYERRQGAAQLHYIDKQIAHIQESGLPNGLGAQIVQGYKRDGRFPPPEELFRSVDELRKEICPNL